MRVDLHNHTKRCNHASGEVCEYIEAAVRCGIDIFGFACHAPMNFDEKYRMRADEITPYIAEIRAARESYRGKIEVKVGFEVDFIAGREDLLLPAILGADVDYLVGSVHFLGDWGFDNPEFIGKYECADMEALWREYLDSVAKMAQSGHFDIVGHFDLLKIFNNPPSKNLAHAVKNALESVRDNNLVLEINTAGARKKIAEIYPSREILSLAHKMEIPITFASDAHAPSQVGFFADNAREIARSVGFRKVVSFEGRERMEFFL